MRIERISRETQHAHFAIASSRDRATKSPSAILDHAKEDREESRQAAKAGLRGLAASPSGVRGS
jgi:hypothetical protein